MSKTRSVEYSTWASMKNRCLNKNNPDYINYGARGIMVCDRWINSFDNFIEDMGFRPSKNHSIERVDNSKGYEKSNCVWATRKEQSRNKRSNLVVDFFGEKMCLADLAIAYKINDGALRSRIKKMSAEEAVLVDVWRPKEKNIDTAMLLLSEAVGDTPTKLEKNQFNRFSFSVVKGRDFWLSNGKQECTK